MPDTADTDLKGRAARKSATAYRTISEVSEELDVPQHVLRFWETKFSQVRPMKRGGGRRYYRPEDVLLLRRIQKLLYQDGYTIKGVQRLLREGRGEPGHPDAGPSDHGGGEEGEPHEDHEEHEDTSRGGAYLDEAEDEAAEAAGEEMPSEAMVGARRPEGPAAPEMPPEPRLPAGLRRELTDLLEELRRLRAVLRGEGP